MEIDARDCIEIDVYICSDNPDILRKTVLIFSKFSFCCLLCWKEEIQKMKIMRKGETKKQYWKK